MQSLSLGRLADGTWPVRLSTERHWTVSSEIKEAENPEEVREARINEYSELYENPYQAAARGYVDEIIMPGDTRKVINRALDILENKNKDNKAFNTRPWRKYSNINL